MATFGAEVEKPISDITTGQSRGVSQRFFERISGEYEDSKFHRSDTQPDTIVGVNSPAIGHVGLDNAFNLQETSTKVTQGLGELEGLLKIDLSVIQKVLAEEGASVINLSIHPLAKTDIKTYKAFVAPKGVYKYIARRGWDHTAGIDAKAQNSPSTGVEPGQAAKAVSAIIGASAAFVGIFANSPFAEGKMSPYKETRLTMWERFMKNSISEGDRKTARFPDKPFNTLRDYFVWMFGPGTNIHFVMAEGGDYKTFGDQAIIIDGNPSVLEYLTKSEAEGNFLNSGNRIRVIPSLAHMEALQFAQFISARIRWGFDHDKLDIPTFIEGLRKDNLEEIFARGGAKYVYIEGRDPGANFPDKYLQSLGKELAWSTVSAPGAIQAGLINNLSKASRYLETFNWNHLKVLRDAAIRNGLQGEADGVHVSEFARKILDLAAEGLPAQYHHMLSYPEHVLKTETNGADRAIDDYYVRGKSIEDIVKSRNVSI